MSELTQAADALTALLARENQALAVLDLVAATALFDAKQQATAAFVKAQQADSEPPSRAQLRQLDEAARENQRRLAHAIAVQGRLIGLLTRTAPRALAGAANYDRRGAPTTTRTPPVALSARA
jgi:hypothetical protein